MNTYFQSNPPQFNDVAVFYLARFEEGYEPIERFFTSYQKYTSGIPHTLIVIAKGYSSEEEIKRLRETVGLPHHIFMFDDDAGFDIQAYSAALKETSCVYACFFNTFSEIQANQWLKKLYDGITKPGVGLVGATGSFESLYSSLKVLHAIEWCCQNRVSYNSDIAKHFEWFLKLTYPRWLRPSKRLDKRIAAEINRIIGLRKSWKDTLDQFDQDIWGSRVAPGGPFAFCSDFPEFPNPHIRSNAFMVSKSTFEELPEPAATKHDCCRFESGPNGLSWHVLKKGLDLCVVDKFGMVHSMDEWPKIKTFRSGLQENLLVSDNQTQAYDRMTDAVKYTHRVFSWGGYLENHDSLPVIPFRFPAYQAVRDVTQNNLNWHQTPLRSPRISIVIPTRGRAALLRHAIFTVLEQGYDNLQLIIFGNGCSGCDTELREIITSQNCKQIEYYSSESYLPVTDSWNTAINYADGDYVLLMGDDDGLAPNYFSQINTLVSRFGNPDLIVSSLYQFCHPDTAGDSRLKTLPIGRFTAGAINPFVLSGVDARQYVGASIQLRRQFFYNMQAYTISRELVESVREGSSVFRSPFPDYYLANVLLGLASHIVIQPRPLALQGVSAGSFGSNLFAGTIEEGFDILNNDLGNDVLFEKIRTNMLPYDDYTTNVLLTMYHVQNRLGADWPKPDVHRYRRIQILATIDKHKTKWPVWILRKNNADFLKQLSFPERLWAVLTWITVRVKWLHVGAKKRREEASQYDFQPMQNVISESTQHNMIQAYQILQEQA